MTVKEAAFLALRLRYNSAYTAHQSAGAGGLNLGMKRVCFSGLQLGGIMEGNPDWPALLTAHLGALQEFERITKALTAAVIERNAAPADLRQLFAAESMARYAVILSRIRLVNANDSQPGLQLPITPGDFGKRI